MRRMRLFLNSLIILVKKRTVLSYVQHAYILARLHHGECIVHTYTGLCNISTQDSSRGCQLLVEDMSTALLS